MALAPPSLEPSGGRDQQNKKNPQEGDQNSHQFTLVKIHFQMQKCISIFSPSRLTKNERDCNTFKAADPKEVQSLESHSHCDEWQPRPSACLQTRQSVLRNRADANSLITRFINDDDGDDDM